jgi:hypothetical protein
MGDRNQRYIGFSGELGAQSRSALDSKVFEKRGREVAIFFESALRRLTFSVATTPVLPVGACVARFPTRRRPSPWSQRLGSHINVFEAFSAFSFHYGLRAR